MTSELTTPEEAGRLLIEPASPFIARVREPFRVRERTEEGSTLLDLLGSPERIVDRLVDRDRLERTILESLTVLAASTAVFSIVLMLPHGWIDALRSALLSSTNAMVGLAAALGPIYAAGLLLSTRIPMARLVGTLLTSAATGAMILCALSPIPYGVYGLDPEWGGPIALVASFAVSALAAGARIRRTMMLLAERTKRARVGEPLDPAEQHRVAILARTSMMVLAFTGALAMWGFDAFIAGG
jgi:hypothetical protein